MEDCSMNSKTVNGMKCFLYLVGLLVLALNAQGATTAPNISNIGFMKNPPKELKEKFPMCDAFLKVEWIDTKKKIGYSHYEFVDEGKKKNVWALITLDDLMPSYTLDIYQYKHKNKMEELFALVKHGKAGRVQDTFFIDGDGFYEIFNEPLLSDNQQTVCIVYPDGQRAWIIEGKTVEHMFSELRTIEMVTEFNKLEMPDYTPEYATAHGRKLYSKFTKEIIDPFWVLDINHDGKPDLVRISYAKEFVIFSFAERYYQMAIKNILDEYNVWSFPPQQNICELKPHGHSSFLTTDGKNYFLNNQCNLTQLTSPSAKE
jgi:hypothetical protein